MRLSLIDLAPGAGHSIGVHDPLSGAALGGLLTSAAGLTAPLWLGLAASTTVIALAWHPVGTVPDARHASGVPRANR
jgi:hypothetical protein